jgi:hypothetical protein
MKTILRIGLGVGIGGLGCYIAAHLPLLDRLVGTAHGTTHFVWDKIGIASIGLVPMGLWLVHLFYRQLRSGGTLSEDQRMTYTYLAHAAPSWGLLGTIVALIAATGVLATEVVNNGPGAAIQAIGPLIGQALISTAVGLVISLAAGSGDFFVKEAPIPVNGGRDES